MKNIATRSTNTYEVTDAFQVFDNIQKRIPLDATDKLYLKTIFSVETFQKKELLLAQNQTCKKLFFVEKGSLRAFNLNKEGKDTTMMFAIEDWWITDMYCFINQKPAMVSLEALEESKVIVLEYHAFQLLVNRLPKFERFFRILFQNAYARAQLRLLDTFSQSTEERYLRFIKKYPQIAEKITQKQIASYLGVTPEFLSSVKKR